MFSQGRTGTGSRQHAYHDAVSKLVDSAADSQSTCCLEHWTVTGSSNVLTNWIVLSWCFVVV